MNNKEKVAVLNDFKINVKVKLGILWSALMFLYIYADYFRLMVPGKIESFIAQKSPIGPTTPNVLITFSILLIVPILMIFLSVLLKPIFSKWLNIIVATFYACISLLIIFTSIKNEWQYFFVLFNIVEVVVFGIIIFQALKWPKN
ncbi:DUF6326 family protein [Aureivirga marina]|uniref:DUF6326 family protein n=1 Tax=Aureivirga marina TaxID=1182451 RepID=UPI0018CB7AD0|nr:DUF6326 family protein [Aureivirga marina]